MAGGSIASSVVAGKARKSAMKDAMVRSPEEQGYLQSQTQLGDQMRQQGQQAFQTAMPQVRSTIDYYRTLLDGSRAARMNAVSGEAQDTAEAFQGADAAANKNLRGGERDQAVAENSRAKAGQISRLVTGVRPGAAAALGNMGQQLLGTSSQFEGQAANVGANLLGNSTANRQGAFAVGDAAAQRTSDAIGGITGAVAGAFPRKAAPKLLAPPLQGGANLAGNLRGVGEVSY